MAALYGGGQWPIAAAAANLTTILSLPQGIDCVQIAIRNATGAANALYVGGSDVTNAPLNAHYQVAAGTTEYLSAQGSGFLLNTDDIYLVGTVNAANIAFVNLIA